MFTNENNKDEISVQTGTSPRYKQGCNKKTCTKKRVQKLAKGHIEPYKSHGTEYYRYRRGIDPPIHLGSAESILEKVKVPEVRL